MLVGRWPTAGHRPINCNKIAVHYTTTSTTTAPRRRRPNLPQRTDAKQPHRDGRPVLPAALVRGQTRRWGVDQDALPRHRAAPQRGRGIEHLLDVGTRGDGTQWKCRQDCREMNSVRHPSSSVTCTVTRNTPLGALEQPKTAGYASSPMRIRTHQSPAPQTHPRQTNVAPEEPDQADRCAAVGGAPGSAAPPPPRSRGRPPAPGRRGSRLAPGSVPTRATGVGFTHPMFEVREAPTTAGHGLDCSISISHEVSNSGPDLP